MYRVWGRILFLLITVVMIVTSSIHAFGELNQQTKPSASVQENDTSYEAPTAALIKQHISNLNHSSDSVHLNQHDKEKYIMVAMCFNYLIVFVISILIILRTREPKTEFEEN